MEKTILLSEEKYTKHIKEYNDLKGKLYEFETLIIPPLKYEISSLKKRVHEQTLKILRRNTEIANLQDLLNQERKEACSHEGERKNGICLDCGVEV